MDALVADFGEPSFEVFDLGAGDGLDDAEEGPPRRGSRREIRSPKSERGGHLSPALSPSGEGGGGMSAVYGQGRLTGPGPSSRL